MKAKINKRTAIVIATVVIVALIVATAFFYQNTSNPKKLESITIGVQPFSLFTPIYVAEDQGFFTQNGLNVTLRDYNTGAAEVADLPKGNIDIAISAEYAVVGKALTNTNISIIANIDEYELYNLVGRKDRGIESVSDLAGKNIGLSQGTILEFYLGRYLNLNGLSIQNVTLTNLQPQEYVNAIVNGTVDCGVILDPTQYVQIQQSLDNNTVLFPMQSAQPAFLVLSCNNDYIASHPETIKNLLRTLDQAETFINNHPTEAQQIAQNRLNLMSIDPNTWSNIHFSISLEQSLVIAMQDEAQWMINNHLTNQTALPNFSDYIYTDGLKAVKPESVTVIK
jgi:ABC-type nitrate/sulfonate/bicarbonate transport system substrate-binding protein